MKRNTLTMLGCSSSLAFILLTVKATDADTAVPQNLGSADGTITVTQTVNAPISQKRPSYASPNSSSKSIEELAIAKFGCDCPGCRARVAQMVQQGSL